MTNSLYDWFLVATDQQPVWLVSGGQ